jgi:hypothetical protein
MQCRRIGRAVVLELGRFAGARASLAPQMREQRCTHRGAGLREADENQPAAARQEDTRGDCGALVTRSALKGIA